jgi:hypothetical protein
VLDSSQLSAFVAAVQSQIGVPYLYGGDGPGGFDCSGLVQWAASKAGIALPRTAAAQYAATQRITTSGAPPAGALVFFRDDGGQIGHVGISIGNYYMVDAPHTGARVRVESFKNWPGFVGATSILAGSRSSPDGTADPSVVPASSTQTASFLTDATNTLKKVTLTVLFLGIGAAVVAGGLYRGVQGRKGGS